MTKKRDLNIVWDKIAPLPIGTKVRIVRDVTLKHYQHEFRPITGTYLGKEGEVAGYVEDNWKRTMSEDKNHPYPPEIRNEVMYVISLPLEKRMELIAFRRQEFEVIAEDD
jgi:hypothetical protein